MCWGCPVLPGQMQLLVSSLLGIQSCSESPDQASLPRAFLTFQRNIVGASPMSRSVIKHLLSLLQSISLSRSHPLPQKRLFYEGKNTPESLEMLNGPQDLAARSQSPRGRITSEAAASLDLCSLELRSCEGPSAHRTHEDFLEEPGDPWLAPLHTQTKPGYDHNSLAESLFRLELTEQNIVISLIRDILTALKSLPSKSSLGD